MLDVHANGKTVSLIDVYFYDSVSVVVDQESLRLRGAVYKYMYRPIAYSVHM